MNARRIGSQSTGGLFPPCMSAQGDASANPVRSLGYFSSASES